MKRLLILLVLVAAAVFAVQGGEYGTTDLVKLRQRRQRLEWQVDSLQRTVDSLTRRRKAVASDPAAQERLAREEFGMVRGDHELLYRFTDSVAAREGVK